MTLWPVPESYNKTLPKNGDPGAFWEKRNDRFHCGTDIYAPTGSIVVAAESGIVIDSGVFTSPKNKPYWNETFYVSVKSENGVIFKYAELDEIFPKVGDKIDAGDGIGKVGEVLNEEKVNYEAPFYIRELAGAKRFSMLHLELYKAPISEIKPYLGGNFYGKGRPDSLIDPNEYFGELRI